MAKVVFANRWTAPDGKQYRGGQTAEVSNSTARDLTLRGKARYAAPERPQVAATPKEGKNG